MARSTAPRWARSRCRNRTPTSSTSAWARPNCAATSCRATASTNPPTPARPGSTWGSATRRPSRASASIPPIPTSSTSRRWAIPTARTRSAASSAPKTAAQTWQKVLYPRRPLGRRGSVPRPAQPQRAVRRHLGRLSHAVEPVERRTRAAASSNPPTAATTGPRSRAIPACPQGIIGKIGVAVSGADSNRVYAMVENENGGVFVSDDAGATWKLISEDRHMRQRAFYYIAHLRRSRRPRTRSTC